MERPLRPGLRAAVLLALGCAMSLWSTASWASDVRDLTVALLYNFAKFVEWPADALAPTAPISFCVVGDAALADALKNAVTSRSINTHSMTVMNVSAGAAATLRSCHVLYLADTDAKRAAQVTSTLAGAAVLTVSDLPQFAQLGGMVGLFLDGDKIRFSINVASAERGHLRISSRLLALATIVRDSSATQ